MINAELAFMAKSIVLDVRSFSVEEALSEPFEVFVTARSRASDLDLGAIVGQGAAFRLATGADPGSDHPPYRVWSGVCSHAEQARVEPDGLSTYVVRIVPMLWRTTQRRNHRIFQHLTIPDLAVKLLGEYGIGMDLRLDAASFPRHEYRVQYGETDFAFLSRLLEEAGVTYLFEQQDSKGEGGLDATRLILVDSPGEAQPRVGGPINFVGDTEDWPAGPFISQVRFSQQVRPGSFTTRDHDFQSSPELKLLASAKARVALEERYELYHYAPGSFLKDSGAAAQVDEGVGRARAAIGLDAVRTGRRALSFRTNVVDLHPGAVFSMNGHPRGDINEPHALLLTHRSIEGDVEELTDMHAEATLVADPYRPSIRTPRPRMSGIQSALVVGPKGEEIYTDKYGRVRVQFHWDREGRHDEKSSCWVRVSQAWAGQGYGITAIPRVGTEVLIDFFEGDPDQPVIVGAVHNMACGTPQSLPEQRTRTSWKSATTPGGGGANEITFEDAQGDELLFVHAQRNLEQQVELDESRSVGQHLRVLVQQNEEREITGDQSIVVEGNRNVDSSGRTSNSASQGMAFQAGEATGMRCEPGKIMVTNGQTSMVLDGPNVKIDCAGNLQITAGQVLSLSGKQVRIDGDPEVHINCNAAVPPAVQHTGMAWGMGLAAGGYAAAAMAAQALSSGSQEASGALGEAESKAMERYEQMTRGGALPDEVEVPAAVNEQLAELAALPKDGLATHSQLADSKTYQQLKGQMQERLDLEKNRLEHLHADLNQTFSESAGDVSKQLDQLDGRLEVEQARLGELAGHAGKSFEGKAGGFAGSCKALGGKFKGGAKQITKLRADTVFLLATQKDKLLGLGGDRPDLAQRVQSTFGGFEQVVQSPQNPAVSMALGESLGVGDAMSGGAKGLSGFEHSGAGQALSRSGGLAASDVASSVRPGEVSFLQTPSEGQLMVVPTDSAMALDTGNVSGAMVDAQMAGQPVQGAVTDTLTESGYAVYERSWGDWEGPFVRAGQSQAV